MVQIIHFLAGLYGEGLLTFLAKLDFLTTLVLLDLFDLTGDGTYTTGFSSSFFFYTYINLGLY